MFAGVLSDLNFGSADGHAAAPQLLEQLMALASACTDYSVVLDARFKGGYITRHYGDPAQHIHAVQLEINQSNYLADSSPPTLHVEKTTRLSACSNR